MTDAFQEYCMRVVGRDRALRYADIQKISGRAVGTLYNARRDGKLIPVKEKKCPVFDWPTVKSYMQDAGLWPS
jgi:hypothetical protein